MKTPPVDPVSTVKTYILNPSGWRRHSRPLNEEAETDMIQTLKSARVARLLVLLLTTASWAHADTGGAGPVLNDIADSTDVQVFREAVARAETEHGAYGEVLSEQLLSLGLALQRQERHEEAVEVFKRGVHIARVNDGLYGRQQIPLLRGEISSHIALGQLSAADDRQHSLYRVQMRGLGAGEQRAQALMQQASWQLNAYRAGIGNPGFSRLMSIWDLNRLALTDIATRDGETSPRLLEPLHGMLRAQYLIAGYEIDTAAANPAGEADYLNRQEYSRFNAYRARSFTKGAAVIRAIYEIEQEQPEPDPVASAWALAQLGDWYLIHDDHEGAEEAYREAYRELVDQEGAQQEEIERQLADMFGAPVALPSLAGVRPLPENMPVEAANVVLEFGVTLRGRVVNLKRVDETEGINGKVNRLMRQLRKTPFRPGFADGVPIDTERVVRAYVVNG